MRQEHDDDGLDGELPTALPWMHELRWPLGNVGLPVAVRILTDASLFFSVINSLEVAFFCKVPDLKPRHVVPPG